MKLRRSSFDSCLFSIWLGISFFPFSILQSQERSPVKPQAVNDSYWRFAFASQKRELRNEPVDICLVVTL